MEFLSNLMEMIPAWLLAINTLIAGASAIAALTPTGKDDLIVAKVMRVVNVVGLNFGNAKNR